MPTQHRTDARRGAEASPLEAAASGPSGAVVAGRTFEVVLDLALPADAPRALILSVEPTPPLRLATEGRCRVIVKPGEARRAGVALRFPTGTAAGVHPVGLTIKAPGGVLLRRSCGAEVLDAGAAPLDDAEGDLDLTEVVDLTDEPPDADADVDADPDPGVIDLREPVRRPPSRAADLRFPRPAGPPPGAAHPRRPPTGAQERLAARADEFAALRATARDPAPRWRRVAIGPLLLAIGAVLVAIALVGVLAGGRAVPAPTLDDPGTATTEPAAAPPTAVEGRLVAGSVALAGGLDPSTATITASVVVDGVATDVVAHPFADGRYELRLPDGIHRLLLTAPGHLEVPQTVVVRDADVVVPPITLVAG